jgi:hypothetical protein
VDASTYLSTGATFIAKVGEALAELKRADIAKVDAEMLRLKRGYLAELWEETKKEIEKGVAQNKASTQQAMTDKGMGNTTVLSSHFQAIDRDAQAEMDRCAKEYARAIEEIALMEQKIAIQNRSVFDVIRGWLGIRCKST